MKIPVAFGRILKHLRTEAGFTQVDLAAAADLDRTYISLLELGKRQPTLETVFLLSSTLGVPSEEFVRQTSHLLRTSNSKNSHRIASRRL